MSRILVIAEHDGEKLNSSTARAMSCALAIGGDIDVAVFAADGKAVCDEESPARGTG
jgi:electron transfer flavoprotein alpha subunit